MHRNYRVWWYVKMDSDALLETYIDKLNKEILPNIDYQKLQRSYETIKMQYAKSVLKQMHDAFVDVYKTGYIESYEYDFVSIPAIIKGVETGKICIGLVDLDISSSGEHWGTTFLTKQGLGDQGNEKLLPEHKKFISENYMPYNYWYTIEVERDHHVDFENIPDNIKPLLDYCKGNELNNGMNMGGM